jgi:hypothetical protein
VNLGVGAKRELIDNNVERWTGTQRTSLSLFGFTLTNNLNYQRVDASTTSAEVQNGNLSINGTMFDTALRASFNYQLDPNSIDTMLMSLQRRITERFISNVSVSHSWQGAEKSIISPSLSWDEGRFKLTMRLDADNQGEMFIGTIFSTSLGYVPDRRYFGLQSQPLSTTGAVTAKAYLDTNYNHVFDEGDTFLKEAAFKVNGRTIKSENGLAFSGGLPASIPSRLALDTSSLPDPLLTTIHPGYQVVSRPGLVTNVDFPVVAVSDIDGEVTLLQEDGSKRPLAGVPVELVNDKGVVIKTTRTEFDGVYLLSKVIPGTYRLQVASKELEKRHATSEGREVVVKPVSDILSGVNVVVQKVIKAGEETQRATLDTLPMPGLYLQLGAFTHASQAELLLQTVQPLVRQTPLSVMIEPGKVREVLFHRVRLRGFGAEAEAKAWCAQHKDIAQGCMVKR